MKKQFIFIIVITIMAFLRTTNSYSQCNQNPTGFNEGNYQDNSKLFLSSDYEADISSLHLFHHLHRYSDDITVKIIDINSPEYNGWGDCEFNNPAYQYFLIVPGDYRAWGALKIRTSGTPNQPRIISYYNPDSTYPYRERLPVRGVNNPDEHVIVERLDMYEADYWTINGLTFSGHAESGANGKIGGLYNRIVGNADYNIINRCLFENVVIGSNLRISHSNYNTIQNSVVRNLLGTDFVGIWIGGEYSVAIGNRIVNNEIYDCNDGVQLAYSSNWGEYGDLSGTVIENNDIYLTQRAYSDREGYACAENAIDIKIGGKTNSPDDVVKILKNRIWGYRVSDTTCGPSGSNGSGIIIHQEARNILIKDNVFFDLPTGIGISHKNDRNTNVAVINNVFHRIKKYNDASAGIAIRSATRADIYYNTISDAVIAIHMDKNTYGGRIQCNTIIEALAVQAWQEDLPWSALNAWYDSNIDPDRVYSHMPEYNIVDNCAARDDFGDFTFYRQRWTEPEKVTFTRLFAENGSQIAMVTSPEIHCGPGGDGKRWWMWQVFQ